MGVTAPKGSGAAIAGTFDMTPEMHRRDVAAHVSEVPGCMDTVSDVARYPVVFDGAAQAKEGPVSSGDAGAVGGGREARVGNTRDVGKLKGDGGGGRGRNSSLFGHAGTSGISRLALLWRRRGGG